MSAVFPISYWGSVRYFSELVKHQKVTLECYETFPKQTHRNRMEIVSPQGVLPITLPVVKPQGSKTITKDISILNDKAGWKKNWKSITSAYAPSPFFEHYERDLEQLFLSPNENLVAHCRDITAFLLKAWGFEMEFDFTSGFDWKEASPLLSIDYLDNTSSLEWKSYSQVQFHNTPNYFPNVSSLDLLCNLGPMGREIIVHPFIIG